MQLVQTVAADRIGGGVTSSSRRQREPRVEEIALMRDLAVGPKSVTSGPIGRCVKRGWCRPLVAETGQGAERRAVVLYALTDLGLALVS